MAKKENSEEMEKVDILSDLSALILSVNAELKFDDEDPGKTTAAKKVKINKKLKTVTLDVQSPDEKDEEELGKGGLLLTPSVVTSRPVKVSAAKKEDVIIQELDDDELDLDEDIDAAIDLSNEDEEVVDADLFADSGDDDIGEIVDEEKFIESIGHDFDFNVELLLPLISRGYDNDNELKQEEVLDYLEKIQLDEDLLDDVISILIRAGIEVIDEEEMVREMQERERDMNKMAEAFNDA